jgi:hypothetical protein
MFYVVSSFTPRDSVQRFRIYVLATTIQAGICRRHCGVCNWDKSDAAAELSEVWTPLSTKNQLLKVKRAPKIHNCSSGYSGVNEKSTVEGEERTENSQPFK